MHWLERKCAVATEHQAEKSETVPLFVRPHCIRLYVSHLIDYDDIVAV